MHQDVVRGTWVGWIPILYAAVAALFCLGSIVPYRPMRLVATGVFCLGILISMYGVFRHSKGQISHIAEVIAGPSPTSEKDPLAEPPALAPLGLAGLSLIALALVAPERKKESSPNEGFVPGAQFVDP